MIFFAFIFSFYFAHAEDASIVSYVADPKINSISVYWKDDQGKNFATIENLISWHKKHKREVLFAANGGMFMTNFAPLGLYIEKGKTLQKLITRQKGYGNFYLQPNGVFLIKKNKTAEIVSTLEVTNTQDIESATQSGPLLVHNGEINKKFTKKSLNLQIRNGVGVLPNNKVVFAISLKPINFYEFAYFFKNQGCREALFLDGSISQTYQPDNNLHQIYGPLGVFIAVTKPL